MRTIVQVELLAGWIAWVYPFLFRAPHGQKRESITRAGATWLGVLLEGAAVAIASFQTRETARTHPAVLLVALVFAGVAAALSWTAVPHLGKQWRMKAGLYADHELVRTGPYAFIRHPIYTSLLAMLLMTIVLVTPWRRALAALAVFLAGTEIRVRAEERLLASRFGEQFVDYKRRVPAYLPFVR